jgi:hypothetical protein
MAQAGRFPVVAYFLEMAHLEISDIIRGTVYPRPTNKEAILARRAG